MKRISVLLLPLFFLLIACNGRCPNDERHVIITGTEQIISTTNDSTIKPILTKWVEYLNLLANNETDYQRSDLWDYAADIAADLDVYHIAVETGFFEQPLHVQQIDSNTYLVKAM